MNLELMLKGWRLTTAEILYRLPDHPALLQSFVWQELDLLPEFPALRKFLDFWEKKIDGKLYSVKVCHADVIGPADVRIARSFGTLH
jgi:uncharacterized protein Usg